MKSSILSLAALAISALAAPTVVKNVAAKSAMVGIAGTPTGSADSPVGSGSDITDSAGLVELLSGLLGDAQDQSGSIDSILSQVQAGDITKDEGADQAVDQISNMQFSLTSKDGNPF
ncbi:hypothetical protein HYQ45_012939 [Verticillium longisporum]|uniref:Uncharacterized protein n=1 Tax=Verticillium longisporum TaxID=100787 RepID=A0A8I2ZB78_VERLO|nr:hypothetical protein HYQ45_012939 [Verticillium longisporum]